MDPTPVVINNDNFIVAIGFDYMDTFLTAPKYVDLVITY